MTSRDNSLTSKIGIKIKILRMKKKVSQEKLAEIADLSKNALGAIERGQSIPSIETLNCIAKGLDIELKELVDITKIDL
ncbi:MAG: helix-turn-helix domain-containing protein [Candidatus Gastranaerophilales bacterium]|nr:helix-turn-helix domain-containing protein [Candidatus Gastranaerophilales bacterium]